MALYPPLIPHPPIPSFTEAQLAVIRAVGEAAFSPVADEQQAADIQSVASKQQGPDWQAAAVGPFLSSSFSTDPLAMETCVRYISHFSAATISTLSLILTLLSTSAGTSLLVGSPSILLSGKNFAALSLSEREAILKGWKDSSLATRRQVFSALVGLTIYALYNNSTVCLDAIGYPSPPRRILYQPLKEPSHLFSFLAAPSLDTDSGSSKPWKVITTDVLVIGSGAGGGVVAAKLAEAGHKVLVIEKGVYAPTGKKIRSPQEGFDDLFEGQGIVYSEDSSIAVLAASVFGGGTAVNWSGSLKTQHFVREEWARQHGLEHFLSPDFQDSIEGVLKRMGVSHEHIKHSRSNSKLLEGAKKIGAHVEPIPQNTNFKEHSCGFCSFGCPYGEKQGTPETWLVDAASHGAQFMQQVAVERLLFAEPKAIPHLHDLTESTVSRYTYSSARTKCIGGLMQDAHGGRFIAHATKAAVLSAGTIHSPAVLLRSGLSNPRIGKNLHLHPVPFITGHFDEVINPWDGPIMTQLSNINENRDGSYYGSKIEVCMSWPAGYSAFCMPWTGNAEHRRDMMAYNNSVILMSLTRDRDAGSVFIDAGGRPRINYSISRYDGESAVRGMVLAAEILLAAGARRITTNQTFVPTFHVPGDCKGLTDTRFLEWVAKVKAAGVVAGMVPLASAHPQGTCKMSKKAEDGVIDPRGKVWGTSSLYVADASTFPTASGVNPMITTCSMAYSISKFITEDLKG